MRIEFLGTGTSTGIPEVGCKCEVCTSVNPHDNRLRTSALISVSGKNILIDCGPDFRQQMLRSSFETIDALLVTHSHYDHTGGLDDLRPFCKNQAFPIYLESSVARDIRARIPYCFTDQKYPGIPDLQLHEIKKEPFEIAGIEIIPIRAMHYKLPILGYKIGKMAYITDSLYLPEDEYKKLVDIDVLIVNALRKTPHISHQTLGDALKLIKRVAPKHAYLIHMSHHMGLEEKVKQELPAGVSFAYDGLLVDC